jgi:hypothetical protein
MITVLGRRGPLFDSERPKTGIMKLQSPWPRPAPSERGSTAAELLGGELVAFSVVDDDRLGGARLGGGEH